MNSTPAVYYFYVLPHVNNKMLNVLKVCLFNDLYHIQYK